MNLVFKLKRAVRRKLLRTLQPCQEMAPLLSESLDRRLSLWESLNVKMHLMVCAWCVHYLRQIRLISDFLCLRPEDSALSPDSLSVEARERISRELKDLK